jgi:tyrosinase
MLSLYKKAVGEMRSSKWPSHHPFSWTFQANIHDYPDNEPINNTFDASNGKTDEERQAIAKHRILALGGPQPGIWRTCSHGKYPEHFLTWHRMYIYFFERIVEKLVGEPFALPYWTYAKDGHGQRVLPAEFVNANDSNAANSLYYGARNPEFLEPGHGFRTDGEVSSERAFRQAAWLVGHNTDGFSLSCENIPHGSVHVAVGTTEGMGATPKAARDPIFWLHHSNIDRLWESWRRPGPDGKSNRDSVSHSPWEDDWKNHLKFAFAGLDGERRDAVRVEMSVSDALVASSKLGIQYDHLEGAPVALGIAGEVDEAVSSTTLSKPTTPGTAQITTKDLPVGVGMSPAVDPPVALGFGAKPSTRYTLTVDVEAADQPGGAYDVYLKVLKSPGASEQVDELAGTFNLFAAQHVDHHVLRTTWKVDITDLVRSRLVDPRVPGNVTFRARYASPKVPVMVKSVRIEAR